MKTHRNEMKYGEFLLYEYRNAMTYFSFENEYRNFFLITNLICQINFFLNVLYLFCNKYLIINVVFINHDLDE